MAILAPAPPETRLLGYSRALLGVTAACLPLYAVRWSYGPIPTTLLETLVLATIALYLAACWRRRLFRPFRTPYDIAILVLLLSGAISIFVAKDHRAALGLYRAYFVEPVLLFYVATDLLRRRSDFRTLLTGLGIGTSVFAVLNIVVVAAAALQNTFHSGAPPSFIYTSSNAVAMFLEPPAAFAIGLLLFAERRRDRLTALAWALILAVAFVLTFSRGGYLAIAIFGVLTVINVRPDLRRPLLIVGVAVAVVVLVTVVLASTTPLMKSRFSYRALNYTLQTRSAIFTATVSIIAAHPILGVGLGGYVYNLHGFLEIYPHDVYMTFWVEVGLLGLLAFLFILVKLGVGAWRAMPLASGLDKALLWGVVGTVVTWAVHGIVDSPYWKNDMAIEFWLVAAIAVAVTRVLMNSAPPPALRATSPARGEDASPA